MRTWPDETEQWSGTPGRGAAAEVPRRSGGRIVRGRRWWLGAWVDGCCACAVQGQGTRTAALIGAAASSDLWLWPWPACLPVRLGGGWRAGSDPNPNCHWPRPRRLWGCGLTCDLWVGRQSAHGWLLERKAVVRGRAESR